MSALPKVVYFGSDAICLPGLRCLHTSSLCELVAVVSQPDRPQGRGKKLQANPVAAYAVEHGIELFQPEKPGRDLGEWMSGKEVSVAFVMAYGHFLPKFLREAPEFGMLNFHGSKLPAYRGASPIETAIAEGETETGVCLMQIVKEMDAGAVADCELLPIDAEVTSPDLRAQLGESVVPLLERNLTAVLGGTLSFTEQDPAAVTYCRKISKQDGAIDFELSARAIFNRMRAFTPWPGAYFDHEEARIKVGAAKVLGSACSELPGTVLSVGKTILVATGAGVIELRELQRPGGRMLPAADFLRGYSICPGDLLRGGKSEPLVRKEP